MAANVVHGEVRVDKIEVHANKNLSIEKLLELADTIWKDVRRSPVKASDNDGNDELLKQIQKKYHEFSISFPIPLRWMVQSREYEPEAFERFLRNNVKGMYKDRFEFLAAQAEYLIYLYKIRRPRTSGHQLAEYRKAIVKMLKDDDEMFEKARKEADEEVKEIEAEVSRDRRDRLFKYLSNAKAAAATATAAVAAPESGAAASAEAAPDPAATVSE